MNLEFYFLTFKFCVNIDKNTGIKVKKFWKRFLERDLRFDIQTIWNIKFHKGLPKTEIDYENHILYHFHNSVCDLTEFNNFFREAIVKLSSMDGVLWLHCSSFNLNNKTYLVLGKKGFGKTTLLLNAILECKATFISNDQLPIFIFNNSAYCLSWRPDIKISLSDNQKSLYLVNHKIPYSFINYENMSIRLKKTIVAPNTNLTIAVKPNEIFRVDMIIVLSDKQDIVSFCENFIDYAIDDSETILPFKLKNMAKYMPYWNKRILDIKLSNNASKKVNNCINVLNYQCSKYCVGNRIDFDLVKKELLEAKIDE